MISPNGTHGAVIVLTNIKIFSIPRIRKGKYFASFTDLPHKSTQRPRPAPAFSPFFSFPLLLYAASHTSAPSSPEPPSPGDIHRPPCSPSHTRRPPPYPRRSPPPSRAACPSTPSSLAGPHPDTLFPAPAAPASTVPQPGVDPSIRPGHKKRAVRQSDGPVTRVVDN